MLIDNSNPHGGDIYTSNIKLDFSANTTPLGTPQAVKNAIIRAAENIYAYPDPYCRKLKGAIAQYETVKSEYIICSNGAAELIFSFALAVKPKTALIISPTFCEYENALNMVGSQISYYNLKEEDNFILTNDILNYINGNYDVIFICNPNNPTGNLYGKNLISDISKKCKKTNTILFLDECFIDLTDNHRENSMTDIIPNNDCLFILKAFTKNFGMAGVRLGYGISSNNSLLNNISQTSQAWNVSTIAQEAGCAAVLCTDYLNKVRNLIKTERVFLKKELENLGITVFDGNANFLLFKSDTDLFNKLMKKEILIRGCCNFRGLNANFYRCAIKTHEENIALLGAIQGSIKNG